jgi:hypothetical protein
LASAGLVRGKTIGIRHSIYLGETVVTAGLIVVAIRASRRSRAAAIAAWTLVAIAWLFCGFVAYTPAM